MSTELTPDVNTAVRPATVAETSEAVCRWARAAAAGVDTSMDLPPDPPPTGAPLVSVWLLSAELSPARRPARVEPWAVATLRYVLTVWHASAVKAQGALHGLLAAAARLPSSSGGLDLRAADGRVPEWFWVSQGRPPSPSVVVDACLVLPVPAPDAAPPVRDVVKRLGQLPAIDT